MAHAERTVVIARPAAQIFEFILAGENNPLWRPSVADIARVPGKPRGVGAAFQQGMKGPGGRRIDADYEIVESEPPRKLKFQVTAGPARPVGTYLFESRGTSTELTFTLDFQPKGLARLMDGVIGRQMQDEVATLENLKAHLEGTKK